MLKVVSILMIVFGIIGAIFAVLGLVGGGFVAALGGAGMTSEGLDAEGAQLASNMAAAGTILMVGSVISIVACIVEVIGGFKGLGAVKDPSKAPGCVKFGVICAVLALVNIAISVIFAGTSFSSLIINIVSSLLIPGLYIYGLKGLSAASSSK